MNVNDYTRYRRDAAAARRAAAAEWIAKIDLFKNHRETKVLTKNDFKQAFDFLEEHWPCYKTQFDQISLYRNYNTYFCEKKLGINGAAAGLFVIPCSTILILWNPSKIPTDAVVVHEVLHYISQLIGSSNINKYHEEDFAYYKSIPYLRLKGYSDGFIRDEYLMPYCMSVAMEKATPCKDLKEARKNIEVTAIAMAKQYLTGDMGEIVKEANVVESKSTFDLL